MQIDSFAYLKHVCFFAPFSRGRKNPLACGGHPMGEEIDYAGFVCSGGNMHCLVVVFYNSDFLFYRCIKIFNGCYAFTAVSK